MKLLLSVMAGMSLLFLSSAAHTERAAAETGAEAPAMEISNDRGPVSLASLRGKYVIINFWSSSDPQSRILNALYDRAFSASQLSEVTCISISNDESRDMYEMIVKADGLLADRQYFHEDARLSSSINQYAVVGDNVSYLISPEGTVLAVNPDVEQVRRLVAEKA